MTLEDAKNVADIVTAVSTVIGVFVGGLVAYRFYFMQSVVMSVSAKHAVHGERIQLAVNLSVHNVGNTYVEGKHAKVTIEPLQCGQSVEPISRERDLESHDPTHLYLIDKGEYTCLSFIFDFDPKDTSAMYGWRILSTYTSKQLLDDEDHYLTWIREDIHLRNDYSEKETCITSELADV